MFLAAMTDLGFDLPSLEKALNSSGVPVTIQAPQEVRHGLAGRLLNIHGPSAPPLRTLPDIDRIVAGLPLPSRVKDLSLQAFHRLAEVESLVHGISKNDIHFHEIGAVDTLVDVVGAFLALDSMDISSVVASPLPWFQGRINCAHGCLPLPAPATIKLMEKKPVMATKAQEELVTPTGALLVDRIVTDFTPGPTGTILASGLGFGTRQSHGQVNGLRAVLFSEDEPGNSDWVWELTTNIDHLTGEELGGIFPAMIQAGALDVVYLPAIMKKNRPGGVLQVLCHEPELAAVEQALFANSLTLGIRRQRVERRLLDRKSTALNTSLGEIPAKEWSLDGQRFARPEFDALIKRAQELGLSPAQMRFLLAGS